MSTDFQLQFASAERHMISLLGDANPTAAHGTGSLGHGMAVVLIAGDDALFLGIDQLVESEGLVRFAFAEPGSVVGAGE